MTGVFLGIADKILGGQLRDAFLTQNDFAICGEARNDASAIAPVVEAHPDLLIFETTSPAVHALRVCEGLKAILPQLKVFLITEQDDTDVEKQALRAGVDAMFQRSEIGSLVTNARAICE